MRRRHRLRRVMKWCGTVACVLILAAFGVSAVGNVGWICLLPLSKSGWFKEHQCYLSRGAMRVKMGRADWKPPPWPATGLHVFAQRHNRSWTWWCRPYHQVVGADERFHYLAIPLWIPFLVTLIPTAFLWYRDRRHPPGHCQKCGYNLTGNESGRCPECGQPVEGTSNQGQH